MKAIKKLIQEKTWQCCVGILVLYLLAWVVIFPVIAGPEVKITFKSEELEEVQIFFDIGQGFHENDTLAQIPKQTKGWQSLRFRLPEQSINAFRIDFGAQPGEFEIKNIKVYNGLYRTTYSPEEIVEVFNNVNQIKLKVDGNKLVLNSDLKDPYIYMVGLFTKASHLLPMWALNLVQLGFILISYIAFIAFIYLIQLGLKKPKKTQSSNKIGKWFCRDYTFIVLLGIFIFVHYLFSITVSPDSISFYRYVNILNGDMPVSEWFITRGFTFPIFLWVSEQLFGAGHDGIQSGYLLLGLGYAVLFYKLLKEELREEKDQILLLFLLFGFILFDSLFFGYLHLMLTEFVAGLMILATVFVARKWVKYSLFVKGQWKGVLGYGVLLVLLSVSLWFLKESHWPAAIIAIIAVILAEMLYEKVKWRNIFVQFGSGIIIIVITFACMILWNNYIMLVSDPILPDYASRPTQIQRLSTQVSEVNIKDEKAVSGRVFEYINNEDHDLLKRSSEELLDTALLYGLRESDVFRFKLRYREWFVENEPELVAAFDKKNAQIALHVWVDNKYGRHSIFCYLDSEGVSFLDTVFVTLKTIMWRPIDAIKAYSCNYMQLANIVREGKLFMLQAEENEILPYRTYRLTSKMENIYYMWNPDFDVPRLHSGEMPNKTLADLFIIGEAKSNLTFSLGFLLAPFIFFGLLVKQIILRIRKRQETSKWERQLFICACIVFVYAFSVALTGRSHDRYISSVYPIVLLQHVLIIIGIVKSGLFKRIKKVVSE